MVLYCDIPGMLKINNRKCVSQYCWSCKHGSYFSLFTY